MNKLLLIFFVLIAFHSCHEKIEVCDLPDDSIPSWMDVIIEDLESSEAGAYFYIEKATLKGQQVFIVQNCCPFCGSIIPVYNCRGDELGILGSDIVIEDLSDIGPFWSPTNFLCVFND